MTFPNPANYYLPTPEQFEKEITELNYQQLARLNWQIAALVDDVVYESLKIDQDLGFEGENMTSAFDQWVMTLNTSQMINLQRWIAERLAYLHCKQTNDCKP